MRTDVDIAADVARALEWDALIPPGRVQVTVSRGWVTLRGTLDWQYQREDTERVVRRLRGVKGENQIRIVY